jgi:ATP-dependent DNA ligase
MVERLWLANAVPPAVPPDAARPLPEPFDHTDFVFEVKHDGFRARPHITGHQCELRSRNGHTFNTGRSSVKNSRTRAGHMTP